MNKHPYLVIILVAVFAIWFLLHLLLREKAIAPRPYCISHRGAAGLAPENTLVGISTAIETGAAYTEVDVRRTADGVLVLMHDASVERTTDGTGQIRDLTWAEIQALDAGGHYAGTWAGEPVPSLPAALQQLQDNGTRMILEAKLPGDTPGLEMDITAALEAAGAANTTVVVSFDHNWLREFHQLMPDAQVGALSLWMARPPRIPGIRFVDVHWISVLVDPTQIWRAHRQGYEIVVWTVNQPDIMKLLLRLGVDGITTDRPDLWPTTE